MSFRRTLLGCGVLASLLYAGIDVLAALCYGEYHSFTSQAISELMASGAPTERLVDPLMLLYDVLMMAFGVGVWMSGERRRQRVVGALLFAVAVLGLPGPLFFEMNVRGSGGDPSADVRHIALTAILGVLILSSVGVGASILGRRFGRYSVVTLLTMVVFGVLTSFASRGVGTGQPTPWLGVTERIDIGAFLLWVAVLAIALLRAQESRDSGVGLAQPLLHERTRPC